MAQFRGLLVKLSRRKDLNDQLTRLLIIREGRVARRLVRRHFVVVKQVI